jgi:hypothetical protein
MQMAIDTITPFLVSEINTHRMGGISISGSFGYGTSSCHPVRHGPFTPSPLFPSAQESAPPKTAPSAAKSRTKPAVGYRNRHCHQRFSRVLRNRCITSSPLSCLHLASSSRTSLRNLRKKQISRGQSFWKGLPPRRCGRRHLAKGSPRPGGQLKRPWEFHVLAALRNNDRMRECQRQQHPCMTRGGSDPAQMTVWAQFWQQSMADDPVSSP